MRVEHSGIILTGKTEVHREKPVLVPFYPADIHRGLSWNYFIQQTFNMDCPGIKHGANRPRHGAAAVYLYMLLRKVHFNIIPFTANFVTETVFIFIVKGLLPTGEQCRELWCEAFLKLSEAHTSTV